MKKIFLVSVRTALIVLGVTTSAPAFPVQGAAAVAQQDDAQKQEVSTPTADGMVFTGKVKQSNGQWVLVDSRTKTTYVLDDQEKAKPHQDKKVTVTGTLDLTGKVIHIAAIDDSD